MADNPTGRMEPLLRRYLPDPASDAIPAAAFRPTREDLTGISVSFQDRFPTVQPRCRFFRLRFQQFAGMVEANKTFAMVQTMTV